MLPWVRVVLPLVAVYALVMLVRIVARWALPIVAVGALTALLFNAGAIVGAVRLALGS